MTVSVGDAVDTIWKAAQAGIYFPDELEVKFFFQAEDGIRDLTVTGFQTCALPIWPRSPLGRAIRSTSSRSSDGPRAWPPGDLRRSTIRHSSRTTRRVFSTSCGRSGCGQGVLRAEIGRASCRERV